MRTVSLPRRAISEDVHSTRRRAADAAVQCIVEPPLPHRTPNVVDALETHPSIIYMRSGRRPRSASPVAAALPVTASGAATAAAALAAAAATEEQNLFAHVGSKVAPSILAFVAGYVDVAGFVLLFGIFVSNVTGDLVSAAAVTASSSRVLSRFLAVLTFFIAAGVAAVIGGLMRLGAGSTPRHVAIALLSVEIVFIVGAWISGTVAPPDSAQPEGWPVLILIVLLAFAMGIQNGAQRQPGVFVSYPPTTAMTAVLVNIATSGVLAVMLSAFMRCGRAPPAHTAAHAHHHSASDSDGTYAEQRAVEIAALVRFGPSLLSFIAGAAVGAVITDYGGFHAMAIPVFLMSVLLLDCAAEELRERRETSISVGSEHGERRRRRSSTNSIPAGTPIEEHRRVTAHTNSNVDTAGCASEVEMAAVVHVDTNNDSGAAPHTSVSIGEAHTAAATDSQGAHAVTYLRGTLPRAAAEKGGITTAQ